jgi:hypothetical protein
MSTGLVPFASTPSQQQQIESLQRELYRRNQQLADAEKEIASLRQALTDNANEANSYHSAIFNLRTALDPLYSALRQIYGEIETVDVSGGGPAGQDARKSAIWEDWKAKFPGYGAKAIDALLLHGSMTQTQLRIAIGSRSSGTMTNVVSALNRAGIIVKADGKIRLKEL